MTEFIFSRAAMRARGAAAFGSGLGRDDHGMNPGSAAIEDWQAGWDDAAAGWNYSTGARAAS
jgi:hypothetical protein